MASRAIHTFFLGMILLAISGFAFSQSVNTTTSTTVNTTTSTLFNTTTVNTTTSTINTTSSTLNTTTLNTTTLNTTTVNTSTTIFPYSSRLHLCQDNSSNWCFTISTISSTSTSSTVNTTTSINTTSTIEQNSTTDPTSTILPTTSPTSTASTTTAGTTISTTTPSPGSNTLKLLASNAPASPGGGSTGLIELIVIFMVIAAGAYLIFRPAPKKVGLLP